MSVARLAWVRRRSISFAGRPGVRTTRDGDGAVFPLLGKLVLDAADSTRVTGRVVWIIAFSLADCLPNWT
jgi:hypothetical protein